MHNSSINNLISVSFKIFLKSKLSRIAHNCYIICNSTPIDAYNCIFQDVSLLGKGVGVTVVFQGSGSSKKTVPL